MAVTDINLELGGVKGSLSIEGQQVIREYTLNYQVLTDSEDDTLSIVRNAVYDEAPYEYPDDPGATLRRVEAANQVETRRKWRATAQYSSRQEEGQGLGDYQAQALTPPSPLEFLPDIHWNSVIYQRPARKAYRVNVETGDRETAAPVYVANSAGDPFDPPPDSDQVRNHVVVTRNEIAPPGEILVYSNSLNEDDFTIDGIFVPKFRAKMGAIQVGKPQRYNGILYREVIYPIDILPDRNWFEEILDAGYKAREVTEVTVGGETIEQVSFSNVLDVNGEPVTSPVLLDGNGSQLIAPDGLSAQEVEAWFRENAVYLGFDFYPNRRNFSALNFPTQIF